MYSLHGSYIACVAPDITPAYEEYSINSLSVLRGYNLIKTCPGPSTKPSVQLNSSTPTFKTHLKKLDLSSWGLCTHHCTLLSKKLRDAIFTDEEEPGAVGSPPLTAANLLQFVLVRAAMSAAEDKHNPSAVLLAWQHPPVVFQAFAFETSGGLHSDAYPQDS